MISQSVNAQGEFQVLQKGYISKHEADNERSRSIWSFCAKAEHAMYWPSRYVADAECALLNRGVAIPPDGPYLITNFQVEEDTPDRFLIFCEAPFEELKQSPFYIASKSK